MVADFALVFNILFLLAGMAAFSATLTLPGIAGSSWRSGWRSTRTS